LILNRRFKIVFKINYAYIFILEFYIYVNIDFCTNKMRMINLILSNFKRNFSYLNLSTSDIYFMEKNVQQGNKLPLKRSSTEGFLDNKSKTTKRDSKKKLKDVIYTTEQTITPTMTENKITFFENFENLSNRRLQREFFKIDSVELAQKLLGKIIVRKIDGEIIKSRIVETEAYKAPEDKASHAYNNRKTERTKYFWNEGGCLYVYLIYGINICFNIVSNTSDKPEAVLIRAVEPIDGLDKIKKLRKDESGSDKLAKLVNLTNGPGKAGQALNISLAMNSLDLCESEEMFLIEDENDKKFVIERSTRINIDYAEEYKFKPWRFYIKENPYVSKVKIKHQYIDE
jgi:DNA-3-methyladenine glycosylase